MKVGPMKSESRRSVMQKLVCDRCGRVYEDRESVSSAQEGSESWRSICAADGVEARGLAPCPDLQCKGELILVVD